jgi:hypothetical protein
MDLSQLHVRAATVIERNGCPYHDILTEEEKMKSLVAEEIRAGRAHLWQGCSVEGWKNICAWSGVHAEQKIKARDRNVRRVVAWLRNNGWTVIAPNEGSVI